VILAAVSDDRRTMAILREEGEARGFTVRSFPSVGAALAAGPALVVADWPVETNAAAMLAGLQRSQTALPPVPVVVLLPRGLRRMMPRALGAGAADVLLTPLEAEEVGAELDEILGEAVGLPAEKKIVFDHLVQEDLVGQSQAMLHCLVELQRVAVTDANVLLLGRTGTGKEKFARAIHLLSPRSSAPFIAQDAGSIPASLLEAELFGYVKGAFTGAEAFREGRLLTVHAGTLLLDEIGNLDYALQSKLLRVLESREFFPLGSDKAAHFHGRVIAATSVDLDAAVKEGRFRQDLLGRLDQFRIELPQLRERKEDIPLLVQRFLDKHSRGRPMDVSGSAMDILRSYDYPRNIRQLENAIIGAIARAQSGSLILPKHLPAEILRGEQGAEGCDEIRVPRALAYEAARDRAIEEMDAIRLGALLQQYDGNLSAAADAVGIDRKTLAARWKRAQSRGI
jgi:two-component system response regulator AtoC